MGENRLLINATYAKFATEVKGIEEQVQLKLMMEDNKYFGTIDELLKTSSAYNKQLLIQNGNLVYDSNKVSLQEKQWYERLGIKEAEEYFTVEFNPSNGEQKNKQKIKKGNKALIPSTPTNKEYTFLGWYYLKPKRKWLRRSGI